jgi:hypothetical protein
MNEDRLRRCVIWSTNNPCINRVAADYYDFHGPYDFDLTRSIWLLAQRAPVNEDWLLALHSFFCKMDESLANTSDDDPRPTIDRWRNFASTEEFERKHREIWSHTQLPLHEEFSCLLAALYNRSSVGGLEDADVVMRCAFYGSRSMTPEQMNTAYKRDDDAFTFAAVRNSGLFFRSDRRAVLEKLISGPLLSALYQEHCKRLTRHLSFDPRPVSEEGRWMYDERLPEELFKLRALETKVAALRRDIRRTSKVAVFTLVAVIIVLLALAKR